MILFPPAKINLGLNVLRRRQDGFHEIESCMMAIGLKDVLEILPADEFRFVGSGLVVDGNVEDNLCVKAYALLKERYNLPSIYMHLRKVIPMGAGLGGGSADATYVLLGLNNLFQLNLSNQELKAFAAELGSDCAFFVEGETQMANGRGEILSMCDLNLSGKYIKLINPGIHIGTAEAYNNVDMDESYSVKEILQFPIREWKGKLFNSFERYAFEQHPEIKVIKDKLYEEGALFAAMSGSGSSVFGIFDEEPRVTGLADFEKVIVV